MDVGTHREMQLAFISLIKIFKDVEVEKKSVTWNEKPELPSSIKAAEVQQASPPSVMSLKYSQAT